MYARVDTKGTGWCSLRTKTVVWCRQSMSTNANACSQIQSCSPVNARTWPFPHRELHAGRQLFFHAPYEDSSKENPSNGDEAKANATKH